MQLTKSQQDVINTNDKQMLVSASAGSGKTFVVTEKLLKQIVEERKDISSFLVLTFTNAAASELKERIKKGLYKEIEKAKIEKDIEKAKYIHLQISKLQNANISTIHSFCLKIIKENFNILNVDPLVKTLDEQKSQLLIIQSLDEVILELYDDKTADSKIFAELLEIYGSEENLKENILKVYSKIRGMADFNAFFEKNKQIYNNLDEEKDLSEFEFGTNLISNISQTARSIEYEIKKVIDDLPDDKEYLNRKEILVNIKICLNKIQNEKEYDKVICHIEELNNQKQLPPRPAIDEDIKQRISNVKKKSKEFAKTLKRICYAESKKVICDLKSTYTYINYMSDIITKVDSIYSENKNENYVIDFVDYEHLALKVLQDEEIQKNYKLKFEKIYIDEYQDTSMLQEKIINMVSTGDNCVFVGDVKQSIYGFRDAFPKLFTDKYIEYVNIDKATNNDARCKVVLSQNFRSRRQVIDSINDIFQKIMEIDFGGTSYDNEEELVYGNLYEENKDEMYKTEIHIIQKNEQETQKNIEEKVERNTEINVDEEYVEEPVEELKGIHKEATMVAKRIKEIFNSDFKIYDTKTNTYKKVEYKDIVILMKSLQNKGSIVQEILKDEGIPVYTDAKEGFFKSDEILLIYSFLKVIDNPLDDITLLGVMYSAIGRFSLDEIYEIKNSIKEKKHMINILYESREIIKNVELIKKVDNFLKLIDRYRVYINMYSVGEVISHIYSETKVYELIGIENNATLMKMNLNSFQNLAYEFENNESKGLNEFLKYIAEISKKTRASDSPKVIGENENVVRIMTIHKSKGLEFPIVILMDTASKYNLEEKTNLLQVSDEYLGFNVLDREYRITYPSIISNNIKKKIEEEAIKEAVRLLYVALTRAKEKLIIYGSVSNYNKYIEDICDFEHDKQIPYCIKINIKNHLKLMLYSILNSDNYSKDFDIYIEEGSISDEGEKIVLKEDIKETNILKDISSDSIKYAKEATSIIENKYNEEKIRYKYIDSTKLKQKYSVSELKQNNITDVEFNNNQNLNAKTKTSKLLNDVDSMTYGTMFHKLVETIFSKKDILNNINEIDYVDEIIDNIFANNNIEKVEIVRKRLKDDLNGLISTPFIDIIKSADDVNCELEFILKADLKEIPEISLKEESLIQGVIDMYIKTKKMNYIIDFKTDMVYNECELTDRYKNQLYMYKLAIEKITKEKVDKIVIYSTQLKKLIEI